MITRQGRGRRNDESGGAALAPMALLPHATESAAQREAGPLGAVAKGKDGLYRAVGSKDKWSGMSAPDRAAWCATHDFELVEDAAGRMP